MSKKPKLFEFFRTWVSSESQSYEKSREMHDSNIKRTKSSESLLFFEFPKHLVSFYLLQQHVKERLRVSHLSRGNNRHTPLRGLRKKTHSHADNPHNKGRNGRFHLPYKDTKNFWNHQIFHAGNDPFFARFCKFFAFDFLVYISATFVTLSHCHIGGILAYDVCCHAVDGLQAQPWFHQNVTLSHCHIGALLRDAPTNSRHPPAPTSSPEGGENCWFKA